MNPRILVIDIETRPAVVETFGIWQQNIGINQIREPVGLLCFAARWHGEKKMMFHSEWNDGHEGMVAAAYELLDQADFIVHWNGRRFDIPHLKAEFLMAGYPPPSPHKDIDLMVTAKKNFRLMSNKLDWYAQSLGLGSKLANGGMSLWSEILRPKSDESLAKAQKLMERYNRVDVKLTDELFDILLPWIDGINVGLFTEDDKPCCTNCGSESVVRRGFAYTTACRYRRYRCNGCGRWLKGKSRESTTELRPV